MKDSALERKKRSKEDIYPCSRTPGWTVREIVPLEEFSLPSEAEGEGNFREAAEGTGNSVDGWL